MFETSNQFLLHLPDRVQHEIMRCSNYVHLDRGEIIYDVGNSITFLDFPESGLVTIVRSDGAEETEVSTVGRDGFVGVGLFLEVPYREEKAFCLVEGRFLRVTIDDFCKIYQNSKELKRACNQFLAVYLNQVSSAVACTASHSTEQRCAKWLLSTRDKTAHQNKFNLTQKHLALMLGLTRSSVNGTCKKFSRAGLISTTRGSITILNASGLEKNACRCYAKTNSYRESTLGY